jgi:hypothetical protein
VLGRRGDGPGVLPEIMQVLADPEGTRMVGHRPGWFIRSAGSDTSSWPAYQLRRAAATVSESARRPAIRASAARARAAIAIVSACDAVAAAAWTLAGSPVRSQQRDAPAARARCTRSMSRTTSRLVISWPPSSHDTSSSRAAVATSTSRSVGSTCRRFRWPSTASVSSAVHHSISWTTFAIAWSAVASPVGRYGVATNRSSSVCLAATAAYRSDSLSPPPTAAVSHSARADAEAAAAARSRSPGERGEISRTAAVLTADASHHPARREGMSPAVPAEATGSTYASRAAVTPDAAFGPATPAKKTPNATGIVMIAASHVIPLTAVPMISTMLPATASMRCATALSRLVPPNAARTSVAKPPKVANKAICASPTTLNVSANRPGMTSTARSARSAAGTDHAGRHTAGSTLPGVGSQSLPRRAGTSTAVSDTRQAYIVRHRHRGARTSRPLGWPGEDQPRASIAAA